MEIELQQAPEQSMKVVSIPLADIDADESFNCRGQIANIDVKSLADNIKEEGLICPGVIIEHPDPTKGYKYKLIAGFRRYTALKMLGCTTYPCSLKEGMSNNDAMFFNLNENIQRKELNIMQEATALARIRVAEPSLTRRQCADKLGMSEGWVQMREWLLQLPGEVQVEVAAGFINQSQIRELATVLKREGKEKCYEVAKAIKDAKARGVKPRIKQRVNRDSIRERKRGEIFEMMDELNTCIPFKAPDGSPLLWAKVMSWAAGEISDNDLFKSCRAFCDYYELSFNLDTSDVNTATVTIDR